MKICPVGSDVSMSAKLPTYLVTTIKAAVGGCSSCFVGILGPLAQVLGYKYLHNHRMVGVGRVLWRPSGPAPCQSRFTQSRLHRIASKQVLSISRGGDSTT